MNTYWSVAKKGFIRRCPKCGNGHIFDGYISLREECPECHESFRNIRTDDAAPWATVLFVGHFAGWLIAGLVNSDFTSNQLTLIAVAFVIAGSALTLPVMKGIFVNLSWRMEQRSVVPSETPVPSTDETGVSS